MSGGISTRSTILIPVAVTASCFMSLMEMKRWIFVTPSQCSTSGMRTWNRVSAMPATASVQLKYSEARSPPSWRLRMLYTKYLVTSPRARPSFRKYTTMPAPPLCAILMHSSIAWVRYGLQVQMSEPKTSLPLHSSWTRTVSSTDSSAIVSGSPQMYTVMPPIGGRNSFKSLRVRSSGYIELVSLKRDSLKRCSVTPNLSATPGRYQTGSMAALVTKLWPSAVSTAPSASSRPTRSASRHSGNSI
mmetsp:Transcript_31646/g.95651  ORF Transcript_31646/g.95651 Transcript_31646/m.95651 type:complete len:245 (-) Transcript_31646:807-1541(-)